MRLLLALAILAGSSSAYSQTTFCNGDECTTTRDGLEYKLTDEEVGTLHRANTRTAIENIECRHADDPDTCRIIQKELFDMFPF